MNFICAVSLKTEEKMSTENHPCNGDPEYDYHQCVESYFYSRRGCQYPWNTYGDVDLPKCRNYSAIKDMIKGMSPTWGYQRETITPFRRMEITEGKCPPPCFSTHYDFKFERWEMIGSNVSLQIAFSDFLTTHRKEYQACDTTCILGQIGGNIGLFLGGSILLGLDMLMEYTAFSCNFICTRIKKR